MAERLEPRLVPAVNDFFHAAIPLLGSSTTAFGSTIDATKEPGEPNHAGFQGGRSIWWSWTAPSDGVVIIDTHQSNFDTLLAVYIGSAVNALNTVASNDDYSGPTSQVSFVCLQGTTYHIAVDGYGGDSGNVVLNINTGQYNGPPNDFFANRIELVGTSVSTSGTNVNATSEIGEPRLITAAGQRTVWWTWTAPGNGTATINTVGSNFDTILGVFVGNSVDALTTIAINDDFGGLGLLSQVSFDVAAGVPYQIVVDGFGLATGSVVLNLNAVITGPPANTPPDANPDQFETDEDVPLALSAAQLLANDFDPDPGDMLTVISVSPTADTHGTVSLNNGIITYTPDPDYFGIAVFEYTIHDSHGASASALVTITVHPVNDGPIVFDREANTYKNKPVNVVLNGFDPDGDPLTYSLVGEPLHGSVAIQGNVLTYEPNHLFQGTLTLAYVSNDGSAESAPATITIEISNVCLLEPGDSCTDAFINQAGVFHAATVWAHNRGQGTVEFTGSGGVASLTAYSGSAFDLVIEGRNGFAGDVAWFGAAASLTLDFTGSIQPITIAGDLSVTAGIDVGPLEANAIRAIAGGSIAPLSAVHILGLNAGGDIGDVTAWSGILGDVIAGGNLGIILVSRSQDYEIIPVPIADLAEGSGWSDARPSKPAFDLVSGVHGNIAAGGDIGAIIVFGALTGNIAAGGTLAPIWAAGTIDGHVTAAVGDIVVESWGALTGSVHGEGELSVHAYEDIGARLTSTKGQVSFGSWASFQGGIEAETDTSGFAFDSFFVTAEGEEGEDEAIRAKGGINLVAGKDFKKHSVYSEKEGIVISAGGSIEAHSIKAPKNIWLAARDGSFDARVESTEGWIYVWAMTDVSGVIISRKIASITAWNDLKADITSLEGIEAFAGRHASGKLTSVSWIDLETRGDVTGTMDAGNAATFGEIRVLAGGNITVPSRADGSHGIKSTGSADLAAEGNIKADISTTNGALTLVANGNIESFSISGAEGNIWAGGKFKGSLGAQLDADVVAGSDVEAAIVAFDGDASVWADGNVLSFGNVPHNIIAKRNVFIEATGRVDAGVQAEEGNVLIIANGDITGDVEGNWLADVRSANGKVTGKVTTWRTEAEVYTAADSPIKQRIDILTAERTRLRDAIAAAGKKGDTTALQEELDFVEGELFLHQFRSQQFIPSKIPADRVRDIIANGFAKEFLQDLTVSGKTHDTSGYVVVADVIGTDAVVYVLEPYKVNKKSVFGGEVTEYESLLGKKKAGKKADYYTIVQQLSVLLKDEGLDPAKYRERKLTDDSVKSVINALLLKQLQGTLENKMAAFEFAVRLIPLVGATDDFRQGKYMDAAVSFTSDMLMFAGFGFAKLARDCNYASKAWVRFGSAAVLAGEGGVAGFQLSRGFHALGGGDDATAWGYFGDATLRLLGVSAQAISFLRKPVCFVAGTPVHAESGVKPIEMITVGERVWAFDRRQQEWKLATVTQTFERKSDVLATVRFSDGAEITGTVGHPFWVIEGENLATRADGDHGHDEQPGATPGRWVAMAALREGDVVLSREGKIRRVVAVETRREIVPVYNLEVEGLHSYAVGDAGILVHNAQDYTPNIKITAREKGTSPTKADVKLDKTKTPEVTKPAEVKPTKVGPESANVKPTVEKTHPLYAVTEDTASSLARKPRLPQGGTWKNADGSPGIPGESFWHAPDKSVPPIRFDKHHPVYPTVNGVEVKINMVGRIDYKADIRRANEELGKLLKTDQALRTKFGIDEKFVNEMLLFQNGNVNATAVDDWLKRQNAIWHHHQDMQTMQLVSRTLHDFSGGPAFHSGGEAYAASVINSLIDRGVLAEAQKRDGLTGTLIQKAKELGIIPQGFPW